MATTVAELLIRIQGDASGGLAALDATERKIRSTAESSSGVLNTLRTGAGVLGLAADAALAGSVKAATDFQTLVTNIRNNTTMTAADADQMATSIKSMSAESGASLQSLAEGYMHATNFGFSFADSQKIVQAGMQSAVSTGGNVADTVNTLAAALKEFNIPAQQAGGAMDVLHLAAAEGNMTLEQLVESGGRAMSTAANLGDSFTDVSAALSALTRHSFDASQAATQVTGMLTHIVNPSKAAQAELKRLSDTTGIDLVSDFSQAGLKAKGLAGILDDVAKATNGDSSEILKLIPALRGGQGALALTGTGAQDLHDILNDLNAAMQNGHISADAYAAKQQTVGQEMARLGATIHVAAIDIGSVLLPALASLAAMLLPVITAITHWISLHPQLAAGILGVVGAIGTLIGGAAVLGPLFASAAMVLGPLAVLLGELAIPLLALAAGAVALYEAWQNNWGNIRGITTGAWHEIKPVLDALEQSVGRIIGVFSHGISGDTFAQLLGALRPLGAALAGLGGDLLHGIGQINLSGLVSGAANLGSQIVSGLGDISGDLASWLGQQFSAVDWGQVWSNVTSGAGSVGQTILSGIEAAGDFAGDLTSWLGQQFGTIDWTQVKSSITSGAQGAGGLLSGLLGDAKDSGAASAVADQVGQAIDRIHAKLNELSGQGGIASTLFDNLGRSAQSALGGIENLFGSLVGAITNNQQLMQTLSGIWDSLARSGQMLVSAIQPTGVILEDIGKVVAAVLIVVLTQLLDTAGQVANFFAAVLPGAITMASGVLEMIAGNFQAIVAVVTGVVTVVADLLQGHWSQAWQDAQATVQNVIAAIGTILQGLETAVTGAIQAAVAGAKALWNDFYSAATYLVSGIVSGVQSVASTVLDAVKQLLSDAKNGAMGLWNDFFSLATYLITGVVSGVRSMFNAAFNEVWSLGQFAVGGLKGLWNAFYSAAADAVAGFVAGILDHVKDAIGAVQSFGGSVIGAIKSFGHSPWPSFEESGSDAVQGFIDGVSKRRPHVVAAVADLATAAVQPLKDPALHQTIEQLAAQIPDDLANAIKANNSKPSAALYTAILNAVRVANDAAGDGGTQLGDLLTSSLSDEITRTGSVPTGTYIRALGQLFATAGDTARGGSADLASQANDMLATVLQETGQYPSDAFVKQITGMLSRAENVSIGGSQQLASDLMDNIAQYIEDTGDVPSTALLRVLGNAWTQLSEAAGPAAQDVVGSFMDTIENTVDTTGAPASDAFVKWFGKAMTRLTQQAGPAAAEAFSTLVNQFQTLTGAEPTQKQGQELADLSKLPQQQAQAVMDQLTTYIQQTGEMPSAALLHVWEHAFDESGNYISDAAANAAQQVTQITAQTLADTGVQLSDTTIRTLNQVLTRANDTARGGSQQLGMMISQILTQTVETTGQAPSDALVKAVGDAITAAGNTATGGSQRLATLLTQTLATGIQTTGEAPSEAYVKGLQDLFTRANSQAGVGSAQLAQQIQQQLTSYITQTGQLPSQAMIDELKKLFDAAGQEGGPNAQQLGELINKLFAQSLVDNGDIPASEVDKWLKPFEETTKKKAKKLGQQFGTDLVTSLRGTLDSAGFANFLAGAAGGGGGGGGRSGGPDLSGGVLGTPAYGPVLGFSQVPGLGLVSGPLGGGSSGGGLGGGGGAQSPAYNTIHIYLGDQSQPIVTATAQYFDQQIRMSNQGF